jgi:MFS family permease
MMILTTALFTLGEMTSMPVSGAYVADLAPADRRGLYMGAYGMVWALAMVFGPSLGMMLFSVSRPALWATCGLFGLLASAVILARVRSTPQAAPTAGIATTLSLDPPHG